MAFLRGGATSTEIEQLVGSWCLATQDMDRQVSLTARKSWDSLFLPWVANPVAQEWDDSMQPFDDTIVQPLFEFVKRSVYDPQGVYLELNPVQPSYVPPVHGHHGKEDTSSRSKPEDEEESEDDRNARIRTGGLGVIRWFLGEF
jgi:E3 ubiquitin-protein ligase listerin